MNGAPRRLGAVLQLLGRSSVQGWLLLSALLLLLVVAAATFDPTRWPSEVGDAPTYWMQAASLAWDGDLTFDSRDHGRYLRVHGAEPEVILQSGDSGQSVSFGKPLFYALTLAPFVRLWPRHGPALANVLWLCFAAIVAARTLSRQRGPWAPLWVATFVFSSVVFANVFWTHSDLFLMCLTAIGLSLVVDGGLQSPTSSGGTALIARGLKRRWFIAGTCLTAVALSRPFYATLFFPLAFFLPQTLPRPKRVAAAVTFFFGFLSLAALSTGAHYLASHSLHPYGGERRGFSTVTGYPGVSLEPKDWKAVIDRFGNTSWTEGPTEQSRAEPRLWWANLRFFFVGRSIGVLPYFLPLVLAFIKRPKEASSWALLGAFLVSQLCFFWIRPFNFYGGAGALANRYFLPLYPVFWFLGRGRAGLLAPFLVTAMAAPFLYPLWISARSYPIDGDGVGHHVSAVAERWLPVETSQRYAKVLSRPDIVHGDLWIRFLNDAVKEDGAELRLASGLTGDLMLGSPQLLDRVLLEARSSGVSLESERPRHVETIRSAAHSAWSITLSRPTSRHATWWTSEPFNFYRLRFRLSSTDGDVVTFRLVASPLPKNG